VCSSTTGLATSPGQSLSCRPQVDLLHTGEAAIADVSSVLEIVGADADAAAGVNNVFVSLQSSPGGPFSAFATPASGPDERRGSHERERDAGDRRRRRSDACRI
jgi:hypothetical protein